MSSEANIDFTSVRREVDQTVSAIERLERAVAKTNKSNLDKLQESLSAIGKSGNKDVQALVKDMELAVNTVRGMLTKQNSNLQKSMKELGQGILVSMRESLVNAAKLSKDHAMQVESNNSRLIRAIDKSTYDMQAAYRRQVAAATNAAKVAGNPFTRYSPLTGESGALVENASALARMQAKADKEVLTDRLANIRQFQSAVQGILKQGVAEQKQSATEALAAARSQAKADKDLLDTRLANIRQYKSAVQGILKQAAEQSKLSSMAVNIGSTGARLGGAEIVGQYSAYNAMLSKPLSPVKPTDAANVDKLSNSFRKLTIDGNDAHSMARGLASGFNLLWLTWGNLVPLFSGAAISFGLKKTFDIGMEVEQNIRFLEVLGDKTKEQGSAIREELRKIDQTTLFSLTELSKAMVQLEQGGVSGAEALKMVKTSADLAAVGQVDLATTTKLLMQTTALFPETMGKSEKAAAQMFKVTKDGLLNIEDIGESMRYASTSNIAYGQSLEDTLVALKGLAQAGIKGTMAGTSWVNFLQDINGRSKPAIAALKELEKASGKSLSAFDKNGKARPALEVIEDISQALQKFQPQKALELTNKIFTERGIRTFFSSLRDGTIDLIAYREELKKTDPKLLFDAAAGMMDTTKGALDILKGAMIGTLDRVFEQMGTRFKDTIYRITEAINSEEFARSMYGMVSATTALLETAVKLTPWIVKLGGAFLAFKTVGFLQSMIVSVTMAMGPMVAALGGGAYAVGRMAGSAVAASTSVGALGASMLATGVASSAASRGLDVAAASAAGTAVKVQAAAGATRALAVVMGFLANPIVGVITTLALFGAAWWAASRDGTSASDELTAKVTQNGRVNIKMLDAEIAKINQRNAVMASGQKSTAVDASVANALTEWQDSVSKVQELQARADAVSDSRRKEQRLKLVEDAKAESKVKLDNLRAFQDSQLKIRLADVAREKTEQAKREKAQKAAADKAKADSDRALNGLGLTGKGGPSGFAREAKQFTEQYAKDSLSAISSAADQRLQTLEQSYSRERQLMEAQYSAGMLAEGQYQANLLMLLKGSEQKRLEELSKAQAATQLEAESTVDSWNATFQNKVASFKGSESELSDFITNEWKTLNDKFENLQAKRESDTARWAKARADIEGEAAQRMKLSTINAYKEVSKLEKDTAEAARTKGLEDQKVDRLEAVADAYSIVTDKTTAFSQAEKAAAIASVQASAEVEATLSKFDALISAQTSAIESFQKAAKAAGKEADNEVASVIASMQGAVNRLKTLRGEVVTSGADSVANSASKAFDKVIKDDVQRLKSSTADAIDTALFDGGQQGRRKLRDLIVAELRKPITLTINALVNAGFNAVGLGGAGGAGSSLMGSAASMTNLYGLAGSAGGFVGSLGSAASYGTAIGSQQGAMLAAQEMGMGTLAGNAASFGSALPWIGGALALVSLLKSLDDSGTYHTGGLGSYSAAMGKSTGLDVKSQGLQFGVDAKDFITSGEDAAVSMAQSIVSMLDSTASAFGKQAGYFAATAFADDTGKDGAWGALQIKLGNQMLMNWADNPDADANVPRVFADGEAGAKQYASEVAGSVKSVIDGMGLPEWAQEIADRVAGANPTVESLSAALQQIAATPEQVLQNIGTSGADLSALLLEGMRNSDPVGAGQAFADQITFGIENSLYSGFASQVTNLVSTHLVTPVVTAMMAGSTLTEAMAKTSIDTMLSQVRAAASAMKAVLEDEDLQAALEEINSVVASTVGGAITGLTAPAVPAAYERVTETADSAAEAAEKLSDNFDSLTDSLKSTTESLQDQLMEAQGNTAGVLAAQRSRFIESIKEYSDVQQQALLSQYDYNQSLRDQIDLIAKQKTAFDSLKSLVESAYSSVDRFQTPENARNYKLMTLAYKAEMAFGGNVADWFTDFSNAGEQKIKTMIAAFIEMEGPSLEAKSSAIEIGNALLDLADASKQAQKAVADQVESLMDYVRELQTGRAGLATPAQLVQSTRVNYLSDLAAARGGDADSISSVKSSAQAYIDAMKGYSASSGLTQAVIDQVISELSGLAGLIPGFAGGGNHLGGWMEVGERGRELVYTPPSHVFSAAQSATMVNGSADAAEEVRLLRRELALMREQMQEQTAAVIQHNYAANSAAASAVSNSVTSAVARNDLNAATLPALQ